MDYSGIDECDQFMSDYVEEVSSISLSYEQPTESITLRRGPYSGCSMPMMSYMNLSNWPLYNWREVNLLNSEQLPDDLDEPISDGRSSRCSDITINHTSSIDLPVAASSSSDQQISMRSQTDQILASATHRYLSFSAGEDIHQNSEQLFFYQDEGQDPEELLLRQDESQDIEETLLRQDESQDIEETLSSEGDRRDVCLKPSCSQVQVENATTEHPCTPQMIQSSQKENFSVPAMRSRFLHSASWHYLVSPVRPTVDKKVDERPSHQQSSIVLHHSNLYIDADKSELSCTSDLYTRCAPEETNTTSPKSIVSKFNNSGYLQRIADLFSFFIYGQTSTVDQPRDLLLKSPERKFLQTERKLYGSGSSNKAVEEKTNERNVEKRICKTQIQNLVHESEQTFEMRKVDRSGSHLQNQKAETEIGRRKSPMFNLLRKYVFEIEKVWESKQQLEDTERNIHETNMHAQVSDIKDEDGPKETSTKFYKFPFSLKKGDKSKVTQQGKVEEFKLEETMKLWGQETCLRALDKHNLDIRRDEMRVEETEVSENEHDYRTDEEEIANVGKARISWRPGKQNLDRGDETHKYCDSTDEDETVDEESRDIWQVFGRKGFCVPKQSLSEQNTIHEIGNCEQHKTEIVADCEQMQISSELQEMYFEKGLPRQGQQPCKKEHLYKTKMTTDANKTEEWRFCKDDIRQASKENKTIIKLKTPNKKRKMQEQAELHQQKRGSLRSKNSLPVSALEAIYTSAVTFDELMLKKEKQKESINKKISNKSKENFIGRNDKIKNDKLSFGEQKTRENFKKITEKELKEYIKPIVYLHNTGCRDFKQAQETDHRFRDKQLFTLENKTKTNLLPIKTKTNSLRKHKLDDNGNMTGIQAKKLKEDKRRLTGKLKDLEKAKQAKKESVNKRNLMASQSLWKQIFKKIEKVAVKNRKEQEGSEAVLSLLSFLEAVVKDNKLKTKNTALMKRIRKHKDHRKDVYHLSEMPTRDNERDNKSRYNERKRDVNLNKNVFEEYSHLDMTSSESGEKVEAGRKLGTEEKRDKEMKDTWLELENINKENGSTELMLDQIIKEDRRNTIIERCVDVRDDCRDKSVSLKTISSNKERENNDWENNCYKVEEIAQGESLSGAEEGNTEEKAVVMKNIPFEKTYNSMNELLGNGATEREIDRFDKIIVDVNERTAEGLNEILIGDREWKSKLMSRDLERNKGGGERMKTWVGNNNEEIWKNKDMDKAEETFHETKKLDKYVTSGKLKNDFHDFWLSRNKMNTSYKSEEVVNNENKGFEEYVQSNKQEIGYQHLEVSNKEKGNGCNDNLLVSYRDNKALKLSNNLSQSSDLIKLRENYSFKDRSLQTGKKESDYRGVGLNLGRAEEKNVPLASLRKEFCQVSSGNQFLEVQTKDVQQPSLRREKISEGSSGNQFLEVQTKDVQPPSLRREKISEGSSGNQLLEVQTKDVQPPSLRREKISEGSPGNQLLEVQTKDVHPPSLRDDFCLGSSGNQFLEVQRSSAREELSDISSDNMFLEVKIKEGRSEGSSGSRFQESLRKDSHLSNMIEEPSQSSAGGRFQESLRKDSHLSNMIEEPSQGSTGSRFQESLRKDSHLSNKIEEPSQGSSENKFQTFPGRDFEPSRLRGQFRQDSFANRFQEGQGKEFQMPNPREEPKQCTSGSVLHGGQRKECPLPKMRDELRKIHSGNYFQEYQGRDVQLPNLRDEPRQGTSGNRLQECQKKNVQLSSLREELSQGNSGDAFREDQRKEIQLSILREELIKSSSGSKIQVDLGKDGELTKPGHKEQQGGISAEVRLEKESAGALIKTNDEQLRVSFKMEDARRNNFPSWASVSPFAFSGGSPVDYIKKKVIEELEKFTSRNVASPYVVPERREMIQPPQGEPMFISRQTLCKADDFLGVKLSSWIFGNDCEVCEDSPSAASLALSYEDLNNELPQPSPPSYPIHKSSQSMDAFDMAKPAITNPTEAFKFVDNDRELNFYRPMVPLITYAKSKCSCANCRENVRRKTGQARRKRSRRTLQSQSARDRCGKFRYQSKPADIHSLDVWTDSELDRSSNFKTNKRFYTNRFFKKEMSLKNVLSVCKQSIEWNKTIKTNEAERKEEHPEVTTENRGTCFNGGDCEHILRYRCDKRCPHQYSKTCARCLCSSSYSDNLKDNYNCSKRTQNILKVQNPHLSSSGSQSLHRSSFIEQRKQRTDSICPVKRSSLPMLACPQATQQSHNLMSLLPRKLDHFSSYYNPLLSGSSYSTSRSYKWPVSAPRVPECFTNYSREYVGHSSSGKYSCLSPDRIRHIKSYSNLNLSPWYAKSVVHGCKGTYPARGSYTYGVSDLSPFSSQVSCPGCKKPLSSHNQSFPVQHYV